MRRAYRFIAVFVILVVFAGGSEGVIRGKAGLSYGSISYSFHNNIFTGSAKN